MLGFGVHSGITQCPDSDEFACTLGSPEALRRASSVHSRISPWQAIERLKPA